MSCKKSHLKKYTTRPGPPYPAQHCTPGTVRLGNNGGRYHNIADKNGRLTWRPLHGNVTSKRTKKKTASKKETPKKKTTASVKKTTTGPLYAQLGIARNVFSAVRRKLLALEEGTDRSAEKWSASEYNRISDVVYIVMSPGFAKTAAWKGYLASKHSYKTAFERAYKKITKIDA